MSMFAVGGTGSLSVCCLLMTLLKLGNPMLIWKPISKALLQALVGNGLKTDREKNEYVAFEVEGEGHEGDVLS